MYGDDIEIEALERTKLASARRWIMGIGLWWLLHALIAHLLFDGLYQRDLARFALYFGIGMCAVHVGLYLWSRRAPLAASIVALTLFLGLHAIVVANEPLALITGSILFVFVQNAIRVLFVIMLVRGILASLEIRRLRRAQPKLPVARVI